MSEQPTKPPASTAMDRLLAEPSRFDFFQAVRSLERAARDKAHADGAATGVAPIGGDGPPLREPVRFHADPTLGFPGSTVASITLPEADGTEPANGAMPADMQVTFMALAGAVGVLPDHYASLIIERGRSNDTGLRDFLDLFNHRLISLFYSAWEKYRFEVAYERWKTEHADKDGAEKKLAWEDVDGFTSSLLCLVGLGTRGLQGRVAFEDHATLLYAGHFAHRPRNAAALKLIVGDFLDMPVEMKQFVGQWLALEEHECTRLSVAPKRRTAFNQLSRSCVLGKRVWDIQGKFRLRVGPLTYAQYCQLLPESTGLASVFDLTRLYAGGEFDFDVQPVLRADQVPRTHVRRGAPHPLRPRPRLGRNAWLISRAAKKDFDGAIFSARRI